MKKLFFSISLLLTAFSAFTAIAQVQEVVVTGTKPSGGASPGGSAVSYSYTNYASIAAGKSAGESMAATVKAKECAQKKAEVEAAIKECKSNASAYMATESAKCPDLSITGSVGVDSKIVTANISLTYTPACREDRKNEMTATQDRCESDGAKLLLALSKQSVCQ